MNRTTKLPWRIEEETWTDSYGKVQRVWGARTFRIMPDWDGPGCGMPVAAGLKLVDAEMIVELANARSGQ